jgi:hypothetical protein
MTPSKFLGELLKSRNVTHLAHWKTTSVAEHQALGSYYSGIESLTDDFAEKCFGRNSRVAVVVPESKVQDSVTHLKEMQTLIDGERNNYASELQNIMDEMLGLINKTLYLLTLS